MPHLVMPPTYHNRFSLYQMTHVGAFIRCQSQTGRSALQTENNRQSCLRCRCTLSLERLTSAQSLLTFKKHSKTPLFRQSFTCCKLSLKWSFSLRQAKFVVLLLLLLFIIITVPCHQRQVRYKLPAMPIAAITMSDSTVGPFYGGTTCWCCWCCACCRDYDDKCLLLRCMLACLIRPMPRPHRAEALRDERWCASDVWRLTSVCRVHRA